MLEEKDLEVEKPGDGKTGGKIPGRVKTRPRDVDKGGAGGATAPPPLRP